MYCSAPIIIIVKCNEHCAVVSVIMKKVSVLSMTSDSSELNAVSPAQHTKSYELSVCRSRSECQYNVVTAVNTVHHAGRSVHCIHYYN